MIKNILINKQFFISLLHGISESGAPVDDLLKLLAFECQISGSTDYMLICRTYNMAAKIRKSSSIWREYLDDVLFELRYDAEIRCDDLED
jgi:hypothetical protein